MTINIERLTAEVDADASGAIRDLGLFDSALSSVARDRTSSLDLDFSGQRELPRIESLMDAVARDRHVDIDVDSDGASRSLGNLSSAATGASEALADAAGSGGKAGNAFAGVATGGASMAGTLVGIAQGLGPIIIGGLAIASILPGAFAAAAAGAGILMAALAPLVGLLGALPVLLGGFALAGGALIGGLASVVGGVSAYKDATADAGAATDDLAAKQDALRGAQQGLASAIHAVAQANRSLADAQEDLAKAPHEAAEAIEDAHFRARQAILSEERAIMALHAAQKNLSDAQNESARASLKITQQTDEFTGKVYDVAVATDSAVDSAAAQKDALLDVKQAELDVATSKDENSDAQRLLNEMEKKGIKNSDIMVDARRRVADAEWALKQAREGVANANRAVARAEKALATSAAMGTAATQKWTEAQKNLSVEGVEFVKFLADDFMPAVSGIGKGIQDEMVPGLQGGLEDIMTTFDDIENELGIVGGMLGDTFKEFTQFWTGPDQQSALGEMFDNLNDSIQAGLDLLKPFSRVLVGITTGAAPMVTTILEGINDELSDLADWMESDKGKAKTGAFFEDAAYFGGLWWDVLKGVWGVLEPIVNAGKPLAAKWLKGMATDLEDMGDYLASPKGQKMLTQFFEDAVPALKQTWKFITGIADVLFNSSAGGKDSGFYKFMESLNDDFLPALKDFFEDMDGSDLAADLTDIFSGGVEFINALNDSGALKALGVLSDTLIKLSDVATPYNDNLMEGDPIGGGYTDEEIERLNSIAPGGSGDWSRWDKFMEDLDIIKRGIGIEWDEMWAGMGADLKENWTQFTATIDEEIAIWKGGFDRLSNWWNNFWSGVGDDLREQWSKFTTTIEEEVDIWKGLSFEGIWDSLTDGFWAAMQWIAGAWNSTVGGMSIDLPGFDPMTIGKIDLNNAGPQPSEPGTPGGLGDSAPSQPLLGGKGRGAESNDGTGAQNDRVVIHQTFNEKIDPLLVAKRVAWEVAS